MQARTSPRQANSVLAWVLGAFGVILMLLLLLSFMAEGRTGSPVSPVTTGTGEGRVAYLQFGLTADTLWLADPASPASRQALLTIPHAAHYGAIPALSPQGDRFAYTALPEGMAAPRPDSPAGLWVAGLSGDSEPVQLAEGVDLLVAPLWTPDGQGLVYRRSEGATYSLARMSASGGEERILASFEMEAPFPIGFTSDGRGLYFAGLSVAEGSRLYTVDLQSGATDSIARLAPGLTRDWRLSPDGTALAFLEVAYSETEMASRAVRLDIATGAVTALTDGREVAFGPIWSDEGEIVTGTVQLTSGEASLLIVDGTARSTIAGPEAGFDVPLAEAGGAFLVRTFENNSIASPGRSWLSLVGRDGERATLAEGEVTLVGWTHP